KVDGQEAEWNREPQARRAPRKHEKREQGRERGGYRRDQPVADRLSRQVFTVGQRRQQRHRQARTVDGELVHGERQGRHQGEEGSKRWGGKAPWSARKT